MTSVIHADARISYADAAPLEILSMAPDTSRHADLRGIRFALALEAAGDDRAAASVRAEPSDAEVAAVLSALEAYRGPCDMPPDPRHMRLLVDAAGHLHGEDSRAGGWSVLGILPKDGRGFLGRTQEHVTWSIFYAARDYGLGLARHETPAVYRRRSEPGPA